MHLKPLEYGKKTAVSCQSPQATRRGELSAISKITKRIFYSAGLLLFCSSALVLLASCSTKRVELPNYEGSDIKKTIAERSDIKSVAATFYVEFEKDDSIITGDAALELTDETLDLRIYSLGFLVAELTEANGIIKSEPELSRNKKIILVDGLRNSILWWMIKDYTIEEQNGIYQLRNSWQSIAIDKKTMLPTHQTIELDNGRELRIFYEGPVSNENFWYPSKIKIELSRYTVKLQIKTISFLPRSARDQRQLPL
ncbi:MAG: hypothetical protein FD156_592 [Nitrospirae bacterium]|nr:MAG: hypothetical protein FD156_592 [Nitrospirota bacterium]